MNAKGIVAVVPMKPLSQSKTRLAGVLSQQERRRFEPCDVQQGSRGGA